MAARHSSKSSRRCARWWKECSCARRLEPEPHCKVDLLRQGVRDIRFVVCGFADRQTLIQNIPDQPPELRDRHSLAPIPCNPMYNVSAEQLLIAFRMSVLPLRQLN